MEALYGVMLLITFILGLGMGLSIPFFVKKYIKCYKEDQKENKEVVIPIEEEKKDVDYIPKDLLREWMTGEEVKPNDE